jgi:hypothetical protein
MAETKLRLRVKLIMVASRLLPEAVLRANLEIPEGCFLLVQRIIEKPIGLERAIQMLLGDAGWGTISCVIIVLPA